MTQLTLYFAPFTCARVPMTAIEHIGCDCVYEAVDFNNKSNRTEQYLSINRNGKVPALVVDGKPLTENVAILTWLNNVFPDAKLLPTNGDTWQEAQILSDLAWISSIWHPAVRAVRRPMAWTVGEHAPVQEQGAKLLKDPLSTLNARLSDSQWWFGETWSIIDTYFCWAYSTANAGGLNLSPYAHILRHKQDVEADPALQRALAKEQEILAAYASANK
jgi:glutathione S-transferase